MGDTVEAIGYKTDVKSRARDKVSGVRERITGATPSSGDMKQGAQKAVSVAESNPLGLGVASLAGGFLIGMLIPSTKIENEKLGPKADELKEQAKETASEAVDRGKQVAQDAAETAKQSAQQHAEEIRS
jgi:hypothetical protein